MLGGREAHTGVAVAGVEEGQGVERGMEQVSAPLASRGIVETAIRPVEVLLGVDVRTLLAPTLLGVDVRTLLAPTLLGVDVRTLLALLPLLSRALMLLGSRLVLARLALVWLYALLLRVAEDRSDDGISLVLLPRSDRAGLEPADRRSRQGR